ncbi:Putative NADH-flavin reductase [Mucilaginibacter sp. OK268]|uniref:NAD(P)-dependent oxidoreductase n=1 Tax=Mucilaginibacter sp. OK268 TaxID=1881048 RepID=UPI0008838929|nr:NAD(P)-binding oxidoreductase [Mucilaginibacter sp. OK268]SDP50007.1 Putative NADH-flavin reductase [Mucilaginibacter sp. OK268]
MENQTYQLLIIGANGGIGRQCVELALNAGHRVTALVRNPANLPLIHQNLEVVQGDLLKPATLEKYLVGKDAVISAIGVKGGMFGDKPTTLYSEGNANLLQAMEIVGVKRAFFISASAIEISPVIPRFVQFLAKYVIQKLLKHMYADLRRMESIIKASETKWTIIRPPQLSDQPATGHYRTAINDWLKDCLKISRADVAHFIIHNINNPAIIKTTVEIGY